MALKRQQAAEDKIALHLASVESGTALDSLPPGRIYGMRVTGPCPSPGPEPDSVADDQTVRTTDTFIIEAVVSQFQAEFAHLFVEQCSADNVIYFF